ncbi:MAG: Regulatory protein RecX [Proteobacteria bacterium]|nr:MAG: Regulatory protein RecX [Pseudomonadota bacterium]
MKKKTSYQRCYNLALYYLAKRQHSISELVKKLTDKEHLPEDIKKTVEKLKNLKFLDDKEFAVSRIRYRYETSKWGLTRIKLELGQKGVDRDLIEQAVQQRYDDGTLDDTLIRQQAFDLLYSRYRNKVEFENKRLTHKSYAKIVGFLQRRGYSTNQVRYAVDLLVETILEK